MLAPTEVRLRDDYFKPTGWTVKEFANWSWRPGNPRWTSCQGTSLIFNRGSNYTVCGRQVLVRWDMLHDNHDPDCFLWWGGDREENLTYYFRQGYSTDAGTDVIWAVGHYPVDWGSGFPDPRSNPPFNADLPPTPTPTPTPGPSPTPTPTPIFYCPTSTPCPTLTPTPGPSPTPGPCEVDLAVFFHKRGRIGWLGDGCWGWDSCDSKKIPYVYMPVQKDLSSPWHLDIGMEFWPVSADNPCGLAHTPTPLPSPPPTDNINWRVDVCNLGLGHWVGNDPQCGDPVGDWADLPLCPCPAFGDMIVVYQHEWSGVVYPGLEGGAPESPGWDEEEWWFFQKNSGLVAILQHWIDMGGCPQYSERWMWSCAPISTEGLVGVNFPLTTGPALPEGSALPPDQDLVAAAYGSDLYLAAWEITPTTSLSPDYDLLGRFVDPAGAFPGEVLPLITGTGNARMPALTYNADTGEFLLAYSADDGAGGLPQVFIRRVGPAGPVGESLLVAAAGITQTHPTVAYGVGANGRSPLLVLWQEGPGSDSRIHGRLLDGLGNPLGEPFLLAEGGDLQRDAAVAADPTAQRFLVAWSGKDAGEERIYLQTVGYDDRVDPAPPVEVSLPDPGVQVGHPAIAGRDGLFVVAWERGTPGNRDIYLRRVTALKELLGPEETALAGTGDQFLPVVTVAGPDEVLVVWQEGENGDVAAQLLRLGDAQLLGERLRVSWVEGAQLRPAVAGDPVRRRYIAVWAGGWNVETNGLDVYGQLIGGMEE